MNRRTWLLPALVAVWLIYSYLPRGGPPDESSGPPPPPALQEHVAPIAAELAGHTDDARQLAAFYEQLADVVARDTEVIGSTGLLRAAHSRAGRLMFQQTGIDGRYAALPGHIDRTLIFALGLDDVPLSPKKRSAAVAALRAIAWAAANSS